MNMIAVFAGVFFLIIGAVGFFMAVGIYNGLVSLKKQVERSWANIDVILKQRHDEIPQLVQIVEQFVGHEKAMLQKVTDARAHYMGATKLDDKIKASNEMSQALRGVMAIGEAYPELKSSQHFMQIQARLSGLEDQLADRREHFNDTVTNHNTRIEQFPDMFFARVLNYQQLDLFKVNDDEKAMPSLKMNLAA